MKKTIIRSLPTRDNPCVYEDYSTCISNTVQETVKQDHHCYISFLGNKNGELNHCPNNVSLSMIKEIKNALKKKQYKTCLDKKPCNAVDFTFSYDQFSPQSLNPYTTLSFYFKDFIVEEVKDSYVYSFISIFSEIGGSLGILVGLSCMTIVEFIMDMLFLK